MKIVRDRLTNRWQYEASMKNNTKTLAHKISIEANRISREYISILSNGNEPVTLAATINAQRYGIMDHINDARVNMNDTLEKVRICAHSLIKMDLQANPEIAQLLIDFRTARHQSDEREQANESSSWMPFPIARAESHTA